MGPDNYPISEASRGGPGAAGARAFHNLRAGVRHLWDAGWFLLSTIGFLFALTWMLITRRLDPKVSGWSLLGSMAKRVLSVYKLPRKLVQRVFGRRRTTVQGAA